uniref:eL29 n=1 Tax=Paranosema locustae TaxID=235221 RepID=UPI00187D6E23|nr:Chain LBB, eL29 [Paranosema locustae]|eukprot:jgi/Antlo1/2119/2233
MAKRKNHTNHNQNRKNHRNGIKKVKKSAPSFRGLNHKYLRNMLYSRKYNNIGRAAYEAEHGPQQ